MSSQHNNGKAPMAAAGLPCPPADEFDLDLGMTSMEVDDLLLSLALPITETPAELTGAPPLPSYDKKEKFLGGEPEQQAEVVIVLSEDEATEENDELAPVPAADHELIIIDSSESENEGEMENNAGGDRGYDSSVLGHQCRSIFPGTHVGDPVIVDDD